MPHRIFHAGSSDYSGAMQFYVQFVRDRLERYPPLAATQEVAVEAPMAAADVALRTIGRQLLRTFETAARSTVVAAKERLSTRTLHYRSTD